MNNVSRTPFCTDSRTSPQSVTTRYAFCHYYKHNCQRDHMTVGPLASVCGPLASVCDVSCTIVSRVTIAWKVTRVWNFNLFQSNLIALVVIASFLYVKLVQLIVQSPFWSKLDSFLRFKTMSFNIKWKAYRTFKQSVLVSGRITALPTNSPRPE